MSEPLTPAAESGPSPSGRGVAEGRGEGRPNASSQLEVSLSAFPPHSHSAFMTSPPERLPSGVSIAASTGTAIFVSNGPMVHLDREISPDDLKGFEQYRADRILVLTSAASADRARQLWSAFKGNANGEGGVSRGKVSSGDLPGLYILKTILDLKLIEAGWQRDVSSRIDAAQGSDLQIQGADEKRAQVLEWIKTLIAAPLPDAYFARVREVAIHRLDSVRPDLQALTWERDPMGTIQDLETISARLVQDVARLYY
jgi:hypothetical protein